MAFKRTDTVVFGGGSLFTDSESVFACVLWWWHGQIARLFSKPVFLAFQGVGPFRTSLGKSLARSIFEKAAFVSVRDSDSLARISQWKLSCPPVLSFDPAFSLFASAKQSPKSKRVLVLIPRSNSEDPFFVAASALLLKPFDEVRILLMQPNNVEHAVAERIKAMLCEEAVTVEVTSVDQLMTEIVGASDVVSQRYHGALAALAVGVPVTIVAQTGGDKLDGLKRLQGDSQEQMRLLALVRDGEEAIGSAFAGFSGHSCLG